MQAQSKPSLSSRSSRRALVSPRFILLPTIIKLRVALVRQCQGIGIGRYAPAIDRCGSSHRKVSRGGRFAPACCAAQSVYGHAACAVPVPLGLRRAGGAMGRRLGKPTAAASFSSALATLRCGNRPFGCHRRKARPNMSVNRSLHGMPPWPRRARCPYCASRPGRHAVPARLPLR